MAKTIGFIGAGNMGGALAKAAAKAVGGENVFLADLMAEKAAALAEKLGAKAVTGTQVVAECDVVFLGVKPQVMASTLEELAPVLEKRTTPFLLVSMAAGVCIRDLQKLTSEKYPIIRIMPNIPASVGSGVILYDTSDAVTQEMEDTFRAAMSQAGIVDKLPEKLIDAGSALSGCGPAFVSLFVEALADGAVACGLPREQALLYAIGTVQGTAAMLLESGMHPAQLKDAVCSPGGSTIEGVKALENGSLRGDVMNAVKAAFRRTCELGK
ncbi:MAG: pyrroline-5-carboxylate reductase [Oscillospiraceae bacterium]|nr:pyrroline-5-carboxylate reductase [Oscillospiraceae bacterium]